MMQYDHRTACRIHAQRRAWQRYGFALSASELAGIERQIWAGRATWIKDWPDMTMTYVVTVRGKEAVVIFDLHLDCLRTFLPRGDRAYQAYFERERQKRVKRERAVA